MNVLLVGGGGREHALAWKIAQSLRRPNIYVAAERENAGLRSLATEYALISVSNLHRLVMFAVTRKIDLTIVGSEDALAAGVVDAFQAEGLRIFGPTQYTTLLESSKAQAKAFMRAHDIPTASFSILETHREGLRHVRAHFTTSDKPLVLKASGLALGKGVYVCHTRAEAHEALRELMVRKVHRNAGPLVVAETFVPGQEVSAHAFCGGGKFAMFPLAQDHKQALDGDRGPMTGGMGAYAPARGLVREHEVARVIEPVVERLYGDGGPSTGVLFPGIKATASGPVVLEYNVRPGDPETQVHMRLLRTDLLDVIDACIDGCLDEISVEWCSDYAVCVVMASGGYPGTYKTGKLIEGVEAANALPGIEIFHAGTTTKWGRLYTNGGRVVGITAIGRTLEDAIAAAYQAVAHISFEGAHFRRDIGKKALRRT